MLTTNISKCNYLTQHDCLYITKARRIVGILDGGQVDHMDDTHGLSSEDINPETFVTFIQDNQQFK